jgi:hypothetical protein
MSPCRWPTARFFGGPEGGDADLGEPGAALRARMVAAEFLSDEETAGGVAERKLSSHEPQDARAVRSR